MKRSTIHSLISIISFILPLSILAQDKPSTAQKIVRAVRTEGSIAIDGILDEEVWMVLRWEYLPASTLYFVWTQNREDYGYPGNLDPERDLKALFSAPDDNVFLIKTSYRWNLLVIL